MKASNIMMFVLGLSLLFMVAWYFMENPEAITPKHASDNYPIAFVLFLGMVLIGASMYLARKEEKINPLREVGKNEISTTQRHPEIR